MPQPDTARPEAPRARQQPRADAASVGISVSAYRGMGRSSPSAHRRLPAAARAAARRGAPAPRGRPPTTETLPGSATTCCSSRRWRALGTPPTPPTSSRSRVSCMQGHLFLASRATRGRCSPQGKQPPLAVAQVGEKRSSLAFSERRARCTRACSATATTDTSAMGQPALAVLRYVLAGPHAGIVIDPSSAPARAVLPRDLLEKIFEGRPRAHDQDAPRRGAHRRRRRPPSRDALSRVPFWVAVRRVGESGPLGVAEARTADGERFIELYSHPLEVVALGRGDQPAPMTGEQLGKASARRRPS